MKRYYTLKFFQRLIMLIVFFNTVLIKAQSIQRQNINTIGNTLTKEGVYLSQSVGQSSVVGEKNAENTILRQGFQQPLPIFGQLNSEIQILAYPNPNNGTFSFSIDVERNTPFNFAIYDASGRVIKEGEGNSGIETTVNLPKEIQVGMYQLVVSSTDYSTGKIKLIIL